jgi:nucleotide sugar dehydrogenase
VDPGRIQPPIQGIPKIISGLDDISPGSSASIELIYRSVFPNIVKVSTPEVAEMTKLYENCQRMVCIAYANEMADACAAHNIDPFEVSSAAATKPFGYSPITPSIGAGGSCIPINPYYLFHNGDFPLLRVATDSTRNRPSIIADRVMASHWESRPKLNGFSSLKPGILVVGVAFKPGQTLLTLSPGVALIQRLMSYWKASVAFVDPLVQTIPVPDVARLDESKEWHKQRLEQFDIIIVAVKQSNLNFGLLRELEKVQVVMCCA